MKEKADLITAAEALTSQALGWDGPEHTPLPQADAPAAIQPEPSPEEEPRSLWITQWPDKPFGKLRLADGSIDSAVGAWVSEQLRRAGTRFLRVDDKNSLAFWPEQDGPEYRLALRLADLDHLQVYSRDDTRIQRLLEAQHPGRP